MSGHDVKAALFHILVAMETEWKREWKRKMAMEKRVQEDAAEDGTTSAETTETPVKSGWRYPGSGVPSKLSGSSKDGQSSAVITLGAG